jgi:hypothetical protein
MLTIVINLGFSTPVVVRAGRPAARQCFATIKARSALADFDRPRHRIASYGGAPLQAPGRILAKIGVRLSAAVHRDSRNRPDEHHSRRVSAGCTRGSGPDRKKRNHVHQLEALGIEVTLEPAA